MADLYTSLMMAKQELNGGVLPAMTPVPEKSRAIIDPKLTIGNGAIDEDGEMGLRCPVRGCGKYFHKLGHHLDSAHRSIGGARAVRKALSIPSSAKLVSSSLRERLRLSPSVEKFQKSRKPSVGMPAEHMRAISKLGRQGRTTTGLRNWRNLCEAQIKQRMLAVRDRVGRSPSMREARTIDNALVAACVRIYGSWNNAKAFFDLETFGRGDKTRGRRSMDAVLEALREYHSHNGTLPTARETHDPHRTPLIPTEATIVKALGANSWRHAMEIAASMLNIYGGRYGLPEKKAAA